MPNIEFFAEYSVGQVVFFLVDEDRQAYIVTGYGYDGGNVTYALERPGECLIAKGIEISKQPNYSIIASGN